MTISSVNELFSKLLPDLRVIFRKNSDSLNSFDKKILNACSTIFDLPLGELPGQLNLDIYLNFFSDNTKEVDDMHAKLLLISDLIAESLNYDEERRIIASKHSWTLSPDEMDKLYQGLNEFTQNKYDSTNIDLKWIWAVEDWAEDIDIPKVRTSIVNIFTSLEPHLLRIYDKFPRNRNERDLSVIKRMKSIFHLSDEILPTKVMLYELIKASGAKELSLIEHTLLATLEHARKSEEIEEWDALNVIKAKKQVKEWFETRRRAILEKEFWDLSWWFFNKLANRGIFSKFASERRKRYLEQAKDLWIEGWELTNSEVNKLYEVKKQMQNERTEAKKRIEANKSKEKKSLQDKIHQAWLASQDLQRLEDWTVIRWTENDANQHSKWDSIQEISHKTMLAKRKQGGEFKVWKEVRHWATLKEIEIDKLSLDEISSDLGSTQRGLISQKWERRKDEWEAMNKNVTAESNWIKVYAGGFIKDKKDKFDETSFDAWMMHVVKDDEREISGEGNNLKDEQGVWTIYEADPAKIMKSASNFGKALSIEEINDAEARLKSIWL